MNPFKTASSIATPLDRTNVDTDQIIPKQFLKSTSLMIYSLGIKEFCKCTRYTRTRLDRC